MDRPPGGLLVGLLAELLAGVGGQVLRLRSGLVGDRECFPLRIADQRLGVIGRRRRDVADLAGGLVGHRLGPPLCRLRFGSRLGGSRHGVPSSARARTPPTPSPERRSEPVRVKFELVTVSITQRREARDRVSEPFRGVEDRALPGRRVIGEGRAVRVASGEAQGSRPLARQPPRPGVPPRRTPGPEPRATAAAVAPTSSGSTVGSTRAPTCSPTSTTTSTARPRRRSLRGGGRAPWSQKSKKPFVVVADLPDVDLVEPGVDVLADRRRRSDRGRVRRGSSRPAGRG